MINILEHQAEFINSTHRHTGLVGGFRSGKSQAGVFKTIAKKLQLPGIDVSYYLPTYPLIKDIAFPKFTEVLTANNIPFTLNRSDKDITTPYGRIIMRSMDNPDLIVGYEVGYSLVDEADVLPKVKMQEVMLKILARNSVHSVGNNNATDFVSTPEGYRFLHEFFVKNANKDKLLIKASTRNNPFISESYIESLEAEYNAQQLAAYLDGEFVNLTSGSVYCDYDRNANNTDRVIQQGDILHIGIDFNVTKMSAVVHVTENGIDYAVDEILNEYDTRSISELIKAKYKGHRILIYPDASGANRKTSASDTDIDILKKAGFLVKALTKNPNVKDRINTMNKQFRNGKYLVNKDKCPYYTDALEQLPYKNGEPDKTLGIDHITDGGGYFIFYNHGKKKNIIYL